MNARDARMLVQQSIDDVSQPILDDIYRKVYLRSMTRRNTLKVKLDCDVHMGKVVINSLRSNGYNVTENTERGVVTSIMLEW